MAQGTLSTILRALGVTGPWLLAIALAFFVLGWAANNPEKAQLWWGIIAAEFARASRRAELAAVSKQLEGSVGLALKQVNEESGMVLPQAVKIQWANDESLEAFLRSDEIVVRMKPHNNPDQNYVMAIATMVQGGLLHGCRGQVDELVMQSTDLLVERKLVFISRRQALDWFDSQVLQGALDSTEGLEPVYEDLRAVDNDGLFTTVFLREMRGIQQEFGLRPPSGALKHETRAFAEFLARIARREADSPLEFPGVMISVAVILVATRELLTEYGTEPYIRRALTAANKASVLYLCAMGANNVVAARRVADAAKNKIQGISATEELWRGPKGIVIALYLGHSSRVLVRSKSGASDDSRHLGAG